MSPVSSSPLLPVYRRADITITRGEGCYLYDDQGKPYLDFASGIAVNLLGHSHPRLVAALQTQAGKLWHCSNLFYTDALERFSRKLVDACFADTVFFCSSGTEAVETAIKMIRRHFHANGQTKRTRIITVEGAFHGRSTGALAACAHEASKEGVGPLMDGFDHVAFHDLAALEQAITQQHAAIMLETIQGEGGIRIHSPDYLQAVRALADQHGLLLCLDEIQCGYGRTGTLFAYEENGITPDIVTTAKGIGGGFPLAAVLATHQAASGMTRGTHGSTYGSNPLAMAVGEAVLRELLQPGFLQKVQTHGTLLKKRLQEMIRQFPDLFGEVRGTGLMLGITMNNPATKYDMAAALRKNGLLVAPAVTDVLRILPPLIIEEEHIDEAIAIFHQTSTQ